MMKDSDPDFNPNLVHNRITSLSALEVRDTFSDRMGWTDQETVALIGGGHTLGRAHGGPSGVSTVTSGFEGPWTRTPSKWNYDYFEGLLNYDWEPSKSPEGNDQWQTADRESSHAKTMRLTSDMALKVDPIYRSFAQKYRSDHAKFDSDFADAWFKLVHRSGAHPDDASAGRHACAHHGY